MYYLLLFLTSLMWSFVPVMVKSASVMFDSSVITFCRFLFGSLLLGCFLLIKDKKITMVWRNKWIWAGVIGKSCNYLLENLAIIIGFSYGYVLIWPIQAIFLTFISVLFFKEKMYPEKTNAVILCLAGVILISWKGMPLKELFGTGIIPTVLFIFAAIGSGIHIISQKKLIDRRPSALYILYSTEFQMACSLFTGRVGNCDRYQLLYLCQSFETDSFSYCRLHYQYHRAVYSSVVLDVLSRNHKCIHDCGCNNHADRPGDDKYSKGEAV